MSSEDRPVEYVPAKEEEQVARNLLKWLNGWLRNIADAPDSIRMIDYEFMDAKTPGISLSAVQGAYVAERFIHGPYIAEYQFRIIYRTNPASPDARLSSDELLDGLGSWASGQKPDIGEGLEVQELETVTRSYLFARMDGGWEDHQIFMRMTYMVDPGK